MKRTKYKFARVCKGISYFAEVELTTEPETNEFSVGFDCVGDGFHSQGYIEEAPKIGYDDWKAGAKTGVEYAAKAAGITKCLVKVTAIRGLTSDTNPIIIAGASAFAFWQAVGFDAGLDLKSQIESKILDSWKCGKDKGQFLE